jgi:hypothetical protein
MHFDLFTSEWHAVDLRFKVKIVLLSHMAVCITDDKVPKELGRKFLAGYRGVN